MGKPFPEDPAEQLWGGIGAVFMSWNGKRAVEYRRIEKIPDEWGTAVNVQAMVFGNMGDDSRHRRRLHPQPRQRRKLFLRRISGERAGRRRGGRDPHPGPDQRLFQERPEPHLPTLEQTCRESTKNCSTSRNGWKSITSDMQDIEFTIEKGKLFMLQCRVGKRNGVAAVRMAVDMYKEKLITAKDALMRVAADPACRAAPADARPKVGTGRPSRSPKVSRPVRAAPRAARFSPPKTRSNGRRAARKSSLSAKKLRRKTLTACTKRRRSSPPKAA